MKLHNKMTYIRVYIRGQLVWQYLYRSIYCDIIRKLQHYFRTQFYDEAEKDLFFRNSRHFLGA